MFIGLDIGTSGIKASAVSPDGKETAAHQISYGFCNVKDGCRELDAQAIWHAAVKCLGCVSASGKAETITVSALGEAIVPIDENGNPLCAGIIGTDIRGSRELAWLTEKVGEKELVDITGQNLSVIYSVNKILWLMKHRPEIYEKAYKILTFQDYIIYRLCREAVIDRSMACRTLLMDAKTNDWSPKLLDATGIDINKLARIVPAGSVAGTITGETAGQTGLAETVKVIAGTHDHVCNALGCGVVRPGECCNPVGTTEGMTAVLEKEWLDTENIIKCQISREPFAVDGLYNTVAWHNTSGVLLRWFALQFAREEKPENLLTTFDKLNNAISDEPTNLLLLPHFSGAATPWMDEYSKGAIVGMTMDTTREELYKAVMEGINYELCQILECLIEAGLKPTHLVSTGGAATPKLLQIKADILGLPVQTVKNKNTGPLGGAMLGATAAGCFGSLEEAAAVMVVQGPTYEPDERRRRIYTERMKAYRELYPALKSISHQL